MDFWTDIAFAVLLRVLKDRRMREQYKAPMRKLFAALLEWLGPEVEQTKAGLRLKQ